MLRLFKVPLERVDKLPPASRHDRRSIEAFLEQVLNRAYVQRMLAEFIYG